MSRDDVDLAIKINWRDHPSRVAANLQSMLERGELCDVSFVWQGQNVQAHALVLAASSACLRQRLSSCRVPAVWDLGAVQSAWLGGGAGGAVLLRHLQYIVRLLYCGWLELRESEIAGLLDTARHLLFDEVAELLERVTAARSSSLPPAASTAPTPLSNTQVSPVCTAPALSLPSYVLIHTLSDEATTSLDPSSTLSGTSLDPSSTLSASSLDPSSALSASSLDPSATLSVSSLDPSSTLSAASLDPGSTLSAASLVPSCSLVPCSDITVAGLDPGLSVGADAGQLVTEGTLRVRPSCELQRDASTTMLSDPLLCAGSQLESVGELHGPLAFHAALGPPSLSQLKMFEDGQQQCPGLSLQSDTPAVPEGLRLRPQDQLQEQHCFSDPPLLRVRAARELRSDAESESGLEESTVVNEEVALLTEADVSSLAASPSSLMLPSESAAPLLRVRPQFELHCPWGGDTEYYGALESSEFDGQQWTPHMPALMASAAKDADSAQEYQLYLTRPSGIDGTVPASFVTDSGDYGADPGNYVDVNLALNPSVQDSAAVSLDPDLVPGGVLSDPCQSTASDAGVRVRSLPSLSVDAGKPRAERLGRTNPRTVLISADQSSVCQLCGATFTRMSHLQKHVRLVHVGAERGEEEGAGSSSRTVTVDAAALSADDDVTAEGRMRDDSKSADTPASYTCSECDFCSQTERQLKLHVIEVHSSVRFKCHLCELSFDKQQTLYQHVRCSHPGSRTFLKQCPLCGFSSGRSSLVRRHMAQAHSVDERGHALPRHHRCKDCDFATDSFRKLKAHVLNRHVSDKQFKCSQCDYSSVAKQSLQRHVLIMHSQERPYHCEICGFRAATLSRISRHRRSHTQERPHQCTVCGARYAEARRLREHMHKHDDGAAPARFVCSTCGVTFSRRDNMQAHVAAKHPTSAS